MKLGGKRVVFIKEKKNRKIGLGSFLPAGDDMYLPTPTVCSAFETASTLYHQNNEASDRRFLSQPWKKVLFSVLFVDRIVVLAEERRSRR